MYDFGLGRDSPERFNLDIGNRIDDLALEVEWQQTEKLFNIRERGGSRCLVIYLLSSVEGGTGSVLNFDEIHFVVSKRGRALLGL